MTRSWRHLGSRWERICSAFSPDDSAASILQALPYLETVEIQRRLPDTVIIEVTPAVEYCAVSSDAGWVVCSSSLKVLRIDSAAPEGLIQVQGAVADAPSPGQPLVLTEPDKLGAMQQVLSKRRHGDLRRLLRSMYRTFMRSASCTIHAYGSCWEPSMIWIIKSTGPGGLSHRTDGGRVDGRGSGTLDVSSRNEDGRGQAIWRSGSL